MRKLLLLTILVLCCDFVSGAGHANNSINNTGNIIINEIMYDPPGRDNNKEYIELLLDPAVNISGYVLSDSRSSDILVMVQYRESPYALIVEEGFNISGINASIYTTGATIGDNLNNDHDIISLHSPDSKVIAIEAYNGTKADGNGFSLEYVDGIAFESQVIGGTPGRKNTIQSVPASQEHNTQNTTETTDANTSETNNTMDKNITYNATDALNNTNTTADNTTQEDTTEEQSIIFNATTDKQIYDNHEKVKIGFYISESIDFKITYGIEDLEGNIFKNYYTTENLNQKSYTTSIETQDKVLVLKANLSSPSLDSILDSEKIIIVHDTNYEEEPNSPLPGSSSAGSPPTDAEDDPKLSKIDYSLLDFQKEINDSAFKTRLLISNDDENNTFEVWGYVYRASVCYSGERESNKQTLKLSPGESKTIELINTVNATPGEYKYKVKIRKNNQKSTTDLRKDVVIMSQPSSQKKEHPEEDIPEEQTVDQDLATAMQEQKSIEAKSQDIPINETLYESKSEKTKQGIIYFLLALCAMIALLFIWRK